MLQENSQSLFNLGETFLFLVSYGSYAVRSEMQSRVRLAEARVHLAREHLPISMNVAGTVRVTAVNQSGVYQNALVASIQQVLQVFQVAKATTNTIASTIFVQNKSLAGSEPTLKELKKFERWFRKVRRRPRLLLQPLLSLLMFAISAPAANCALI